MALPGLGAAPSRHPWLDTFARDPVAAFGDLLAGFARIPPYERADAPDAARMLFGPLPSDDPVRMLLGEAILGWLAQRRHEAPPADRPALQHWVAEICEAFEIVAFLEVTDAAAVLRRQYVIWNEWSSAFSLAPSRDAHAEYWRMLALTQPFVDRAGATNDPNGLAPLWLDICRQAGAALPKRYLNIGLLGLRRLPAAVRGTEVPWIAGLAHWAMARNPTEAEFKAQWLALKPFYPRAPNHWCQLVGRLLATTTYRSQDIEAPAWWGCDPDFAPLRRENFRRTGEPVRNPGSAALNPVLLRIGEPWARIENAVDRHLQAELRFVQATGDSHYFVRSMHALGTALIETQADQPQARARKAQALAMEGLEWEPYNRHLWSLWSDALAAEGALDAAEQVDWESIRRDPENAEYRNQLATLLADTRGRPVEAEALLRDTIAACPGASSC